MQIVSVGCGTEELVLVLPAPVDRAWVMEYMAREWKDKRVQTIDFLPPEPLYYHWNTIPSSPKQ